MRARQQRGRRPPATAAPPLALYSPPGGRWAAALLLVLLLEASGPACATAAARWEPCSGGGGLRRLRQAGRAPTPGALLACVPSYPAGLQLARLQLAGRRVADSARRAALARAAPHRARALPTLLPLPAPAGVSDGANSTIETVEVDVVSQVRPSPAVAAARRAAPPPGAALCPAGRPRAPRRRPCPACRHLAPPHPAVPAAFPLPQECSMSVNVYLQASAPGVRQITQPDANLQPSARTCCAACHDIPACSAFQWCALVCPGAGAPWCAWACAPAQRGAGPGPWAALPRRAWCPLHALLLLRTAPTPPRPLVPRRPQVPVGGRLRRRQQQRHQRHLPIPGLPAAGPVGLPAHQRQHRRNQGGGARRALHRRWGAAASPAAACCPRRTRLQGRCGCGCKGVAAARAQGCPAWPAAPPAPLLSLPLAARSALTGWCCPCASPLPACCRHPAVLFGAQAVWLRRGGRPQLWRSAALLCSSRAAVRLLARGLPCRLLRRCCCLGPGVPLHRCRRRGPPCRCWAGARRGGRPTPLRAPTHCPCRQVQLLMRRLGSQRLVCAAGHRAGKLLWGEAALLQGRGRCCSCRCATGRALASCMLYSPAAPPAAALALSPARPAPRSRP